MKNTKITAKTLTIFNLELTSMEVQKLLKHKGPIMFENTPYNRKAVAQEMDKILRKTPKK